MYNLSQNRLEEVITFWQELARSLHLQFDLGIPFVGRPRVIGEYRGCSIRLSVGGTNFDFIELELSRNTLQPDNLPRKSKEHPGKRLSVKDISRLLMPNGLSYRLRGRMSAKAYGKKFGYVQGGFEYEIKYLRFVINLLSDLANNYHKVMMWGGEAVSALQLIAKGQDAVLQPIALQLLYDIAAETESRLAQNPRSFLCPYCLTHPDAYSFDISRLRSITYYGCRMCGQSREFLAKPGIMVLDQGMAAERIEQAEELSLNWFSHRNLFDFSEVRIVQATDEEVERFAIQVGNDTDPVRKKYYRSIPCLVWSDCQLSENTMRILRHSFGDVTIKTNTDLLHD